MSKIKESRKLWETKKKNLRRRLHTQGNSRELSPPSDLLHFSNSSFQTMGFQLRRVRQSDEMLQGVLEGGFMLLLVHSLFLKMKIQILEIDQCFP